MEMGEDLDTKKEIKEELSKSRKQVTLRLSCMQFYIHYCLAIQIKMKLPEYP